MSLDLALVMPVYNEQDCIVAVLHDWLSTLNNLGLSYQIVVLNDGSTDQTAKVLEVFAHDERLEIINKANSGHGPTILEGYQKAVKIADWVFQCDSDDEMKPSHFAKLWEKRERFDALFGMRSGREQSPPRRLITLVSRVVVKLLFGRGVRDVNVPYRLMRADLLRQILPQIPADTFAPNILISGTFARAHCKIYNLPVPHEGRKTGSVSIMKWKLWRAAGLSFFQTLRCRPQLKRPVRHKASVPQK